MPKKGIMKFVVRFSIPTKTIIVVNIATQILVLFTLIAFLLTNSLINIYQKYKVI